MLLFRGVDIGAELFAMAATTCRAQMLVRTGKEHAEDAVELADLFCRVSRRRVAELFRELRSNDDELLYRTARKVLDGGHEWLEEGVVGLQEVSLEGYWSEVRDVEPVMAGAPAGG